tara:strand:+ start:120 stop:725 length:606 start_codon:yes stop_codon:yes gene_type:complete
MLTIIDNFYEPHDLGLMTLGFVNLPFSPTYHSKEWPISHRMQGYPCWESEEIPHQESDVSPYQIFLKTFIKKTNIKPIVIRTLFRKIKLEELKQAEIYKKERPHQDNENFDFAGLIYYNSNSIKDGTKLYNAQTDFEPTVIAGSRMNRCIFYNTQQPHSTPTDQWVDERWVQPFFLITKEETFIKFKEDKKQDEHKEWNTA